MSLHYRINLCLQVYNNSLLFGFLTRNFRICHPVKGILCILKFRWLKNHNIPLRICTLSFYCICRLRYCNLQQFFFGSRLNGLTNCLFRNLDNQKNNLDMAYIFLENCGISHNKNRFCSLLFHSKNFHCHHLRSLYIYRWNNRRRRHKGFHHLGHQNMYQIGILSVQIILYITLEV